MFGVFRNAIIKDHFSEERFKQEVAKRGFKLLDVDVFEPIKGKTDYVSIKIAAKSAIDGKTYHVGEHLYTGPDKTKSKKTLRDLENPEFSDRFVETFGQITEQIMKETDDSKSKI